jgi:hypothetical protein
MPGGDHIDGSSAFSFARAWDTKRGVPSLKKYMFNEGHDFSVYSTSNTTGVV